MNTTETTKLILKKYNSDAEANLLIMVPGKRLDLIKLFAELGFKTGAEVGVYKGHHAKVICDNVALDKLYCIDSWTTRKGYSEGGKGEKSISKRYHSVQAHLSGCPCEIIKKTSMEAVKDFLPNSLDFVYIDAMHEYGYVLEDITEWSKIVRPGGIVSGHDYECAHHPEVSYAVSRAVKDYSTGHKIKRLYVFSGEPSTTWFFVNE